MSTVGHSTLSTWKHGIRTTSISLCQDISRVVKIVEASANSGRWRVRWMTVSSHMGTRNALSFHGKAQMKWIPLVDEGGR